MTRRWRWHFLHDGPEKELGTDPVDLSGAQQMRDMENARTVYYRNGFYFKLYHPKCSGILQALCARLSPHAAREFRAIRRLHRLRIAAVEPVAFGVCGTSSMLITREEKDCRSVMEYLRERFLRNEEFPEPFLLDWSRFLARFFAAGLYLPDFNCGNLLYHEDENRFVLVDPLGLKRSIFNRSERKLRMLKREFGAVFSCVPKPRILKMLAVFAPADPEGLYRRLLRYDAEYVRRSQMRDMKRLKRFRAGSSTRVLDGIRIKKTVFEVPFPLEDTEKITLPPEEANELWERDYLMSLCHLPLLRVVARDENDGTLYRQLPGSREVTEAERAYLRERLELAGFDREGFDCCVNRAGLAVLRDRKFFRK